MVISKKILIFLIVAVSILFLSSCGSDDEGPRCSIDSDCPLAGTCAVAQCVDSYCQVQKKVNCCGNGMCEVKAEEDVCSCKADCPGTCEGPVEFTLPGGAKQKSKYFNYGCTSKEESKKKCIIRYDLSEIDPREEYHEIKKDNILVGVTIGYIQPFVIKQQEMSIELQLKDFTSEKVKTPLTINEIRVMESTLLLGRKRNIDKDLDDIGDIYSTTILLDYSMGLPEEQKSVSVEVDYQYKSVQTDGKTKLFISKDTKTLKHRIYFLDPDYDEVKVDFSQD